jgi:hypothetical protein
LRELHKLHKRHFSGGFENASFCGDIYREAGGHARGTAVYRMAAET